MMHHTQSKAPTATLAILGGIAIFGAYLAVTLYGARLLVREIPAVRRYLRIRRM